MTIRQARKILAEYLVRMDMTEWTVFLRWGTKKEMEDLDGRCIWSPEYTHCEIVIRRDQADSEIPKTVVHELVHVCLQGHKENHSRYDTMYERGINRITLAIIGSNN